MFNYERGSGELGRYERIYFNFIRVNLHNLPDPRSEKLKIC